MARAGESPTRTPRRNLGTAAFLLAVVSASWACGRADAADPTSLSDPAFQKLREASVNWDRRLGPERNVVDVVCLVPDVPTFLEVIATWDESHFFPVLIDDVEQNLKFLRAFRPSKVVRFPAKGAPFSGEDLWPRALVAAGRAWSPEGAPLREQPRGDFVPKSLGPLPPGVVVSHPSSPTLAGAVALAAGRFQPLIRLETKKKYADVLTTQEALEFAFGLEAEIATAVGPCWTLGDECDFATLAGDYPYRFAEEGNTNALDDLVLRSYPSKERWGFAGRLIGGPVASVHQAMCALFLKADSALMFNGYGESDDPWRDFSMTGAAAALNRTLRVAHRNGKERAKLNGWHQAFDPFNRYDLLLINSSGGSTNFALHDGPNGHTADVPESGPVAVSIIHSYSASSPENPDTIAGRWLANGAFVYFGSTNEPYLQAFRTPALVTSCLMDNLPFVAAVRKQHFELFGQPWRLIYVGDPLYRIRPTSESARRLADWPPIKSWSAYQRYQAPAEGAAESVRLAWALKTAINGLQSGAAAANLKEIAAVLLGIDRARLDAELRPILEALLVDVLLQSGRSAELLDWLERVPRAERSADVRRHLETARSAALARATTAGDFRQALALWNGVIGDPSPADFARAFTERVGAMADSPTRLSGWRERLRAAKQAAAEPANAPIIDEALKGVDAKMKDRR